jgi:HlyD family secretion protein
MVTNQKSKEDQEELNQRLRSLKIERVPIPSPASKSRSPKILFLLIAAVLALAALGYIFFFSGTKAITVAAVTTDTGSSSAGESMLSASGYVVAHHKIAVGAKVMGRVAWIGVDTSEAGVATRIVRVP